MLFNEAHRNTQALTFCDAECIAVRHLWQSDASGPQQNA